MAASVLIVDDHSGFRAQARRLLECEGYRVIGEAADARSGLRAARELEPELALVDIYIPDVDGFELATQLAGLAAPPAVVLISSHDGEELEPFVTESDARGFVAKANLSREAIEELLG
jgi:DNA-binding NarL/FixJ family response regulator